MSQMKTLLGFASLVVAIAGVPNLGHAQSCKSDADCAKGSTCLSTIVTPSSGSPNAADPVQNTATCHAVHCVTDSDCDVDMLCHSETSTTCSGSGSRPACPPNTKCDTAVTTTSMCTDTTTWSCVYKWQLPCNTAADCGSDFDCKPTVTGGCSGGSAGAARGATAGTTGSEKPAATPVGAPTGGSAGSSADSCTTSSTFPGYCQAKAITCATDGDCPAHWTCVDLAPPRVGGGGTNSSAGAGGETASTTTPTAGASPAAPTKMCQAPNTYTARDAVAGTGTTTGTGLSADGGTGTPEPASGTATGSKSNPEVAKNGSDGSGCSVAGGGALASSAALGIGALMLGFVIARGRRKAAPARR